MRLRYAIRIQLLAVLLTVVMLLLMAALWWPKINRTVPVMDILFVLDITQSMDVADVKRNGQRVSRLAWSKDFVHKTLTELPCGSHVGLAVFAEARSLILINPVDVCKNYHDLTAMLDRINRTLAWALASEISKGVFTAIKQARHISPPPGIVFITDGHEAPPLNKTLYPKFRGKVGEIKGVFVGVGGEALMPIPKHDLAGHDLGFWKKDEVLQQDVYVSSRNDLTEVKKRKPQNEHLSSQKKDHLAKLAAMVGFDYLSSPTSPQQLIAALQDNVNTHTQRVQYDLAPWFGWAALVLLLGIYFPSFARHRKT